MKWAIISEWRRNPEREDTTEFTFEAFQEQQDAEQALADAHRRGIGWGYGFNWPRYRGMVARPVTTWLDRDTHPLLWKHMVDGTVWLNEVWLGRTHLGWVVSIGMAGAEDAIESYLMSHPTPDMW